MQRIFICVKARLKKLYKILGLDFNNDSLHFLTKGGFDGKENQVLSCGAFRAFPGLPRLEGLPKEKLGGVVEFYDPRFDTLQGSIATFVSDDLHGVETCDVVFYFMTDSGEPGSAIECDRGDCKNKLVVLCIDRTVNVVNPFLIGIARRVLFGIETGERYLKKLADYGLGHEFRAITEMLGEG